MQKQWVGEGMFVVLQDARMLLITAAFGHMRKRIIPGMLNQLEGALGVSIGRERDVRVFLLYQESAIFN